MPNATTLDSCPAEFILSAAAPESPGKDARLLDQLKHQNRRALERSCGTLPVGRRPRRTSKN